ncbi:MAG: hypothetical protein GDA56_08510 [Hormoscilla sp. GM7CHS1pb]|nr:hypothetical protein [Hormoscilla sp. GM7CHS1pb]
MLDAQKCAELIRQHFAEITTKQFLENLTNSSPELFEDDALPSSAESLLSESNALKELN